MPSIHVWKSIAVAAEKGGYAGAPESLPLWDMSKRELVEIAMRLGEQCGDDFSVEGAAARVLEEHRILREQGII